MVSKYVVGINFTYHESKRYSKRILFASETDESCRSLNWNIKTTFSIERIQFASAKTEMILFTNVKFDLTEHQITLGNDILQFKIECNLLGFHTDNRLTFYVTFIRYITSKLFRNSGILCKFRDSVLMEAQINFH